MNLSYDPGEDGGLAVFDEDIDGEFACGRNVGLGVARLIDGGEDILRAPGNGS